MRDKLKKEMKKFEAQNELLFKIFNEPPETYKKILEKKLKVKKLI